MSSETAVVDKIDSSRAPSGGIAANRSPHSDPPRHHRRVIEISGTLGAVTKADSRPHPRSAGSSTQRILWSKVISIRKEETLGESAYGRDRRTG